MITKKTFAKQHIALIVLLFAIIIIFTPHMLRSTFYNNLLIGEQPYYHARKALDIKNQGPVLIDKLSYGGKPYILNAYHILLALLSDLIEVEKLSRILPFLSGITSICLLFVLMKQFKIDPSRRNLTLFFLALTPAFIYTFTVSNPTAVGFCLNLFAIFFFTKKSRVLSYFSVLLFMIVPFFGFHNMLFSFVFLIFYHMVNKDKVEKYIKKVKLTFVTVVLIVIVSIINFGSIVSNLGFSHFYPDFITRNIFVIFITDFGGMIGFSMFLILLSVIGLFITWRDKGRYVTFYLILIFTFIYKYYNDDVSIYLALMLCFLGAVGFLKLASTKWEIDEIKHILPLLLICGLLFTTMSYSSVLVKQGPDKETVRSLIWLKDNAPKNSLVLSHFQNGYWIEYFSGLPVYMDLDFLYSPNPQKRYELSEGMFYSRDLEYTSSLLHSQRIKYIYIDSRMKSGLVWSSPKQGLLFLFRNNETFKKLYTNSYVEIREVVPLEKD